MQNKNSQNKRGLVIGMYMLIITAIGCDQKQPDQPSPDRQSSSTGFKMNCVLLHRDTIQKWVEKGWTKSSGPDTIKAILLQAYSADVLQADSNNALLAYAATSFTNVIGDSTILRVDTTCVAKKIDGRVAMTSNFIGFKDLQITNPDGTLKDDFTFIRFRPIQDAEFRPYISYAVEVVRTDEEGKVIGTPRSVGRGTYPCPKYCNFF